MRVFVLALAFIILSFYIYSPEQPGPLKDDTYTLPPKQDDTEVPNVDRTDPDKQPEEGLGSYIGKSEHQFIERYGQPNRKEPSAYGYEWWVYHEDPDVYMQAGVENGRVVTIYAVGTKLDVTPFKMGQSIEDIYRSMQLETEIVIKNKQGTYRFDLSEEDLNIRPLIRLGDIFAQLSVDKFTGSLFSVRFLNQDTLIKQRPYELVYKGDLIEPEDPDEELWGPIESGSEKQIYDLTNIFRKKFDLPPLKWDDLVADVAYGHSMDMGENEYFSHDSPAFGDLSNRLSRKHILFQSAGENIASEYIDGPSALEGWINSESHRKTLLENEYTHIGVGVYRKNYTQNFIRPKEI